MERSLLYVLGDNRTALVFSILHVALLAGTAVVLVRALDDPRGYGIAEVVALAAYAVVHVRRATGGPGRLRRDRALGRRVRAAALRRVRPARARAAPLCPAGRRPAPACTAADDPRVHRRPAPWRPRRSAPLVARSAESGCQPVAGRPPRGPRGRRGRRDHVAQDPSSVELGLPADRRADLARSTGSRWSMSSIPCP